MLSSAIILNPRVSQHRLTWFSTINTALQEIEPGLFKKSFSLARSLHFILLGMTKFTNVNDTSFRMGFFSVGRAKRDIKSGQQLQVEDAYKGDQKGCLTPWIEPLSTFTPRVNFKNEMRRSRVPLTKKTSRTRIYVWKFRLPFETRKLKFHALNKKYRLLSQYLM